MEWLSDWIVEISHYSRDYLSLISLGLVAVLLVLIGKPIISWNNRWIGRFPSFLQLVVRSVVNLLIFGTILFYFPEWFEYLLNLFNNLTLAPVLVITILVSGALTERFGRS